MTGKVCKVNAGFCPQANCAGKMTEKVYALNAGLKNKKMRRGNDGKSMDSKCRLLSSIKLCRGND